MSQRYAVVIGKQFVSRGRGKIAWVRSYEAASHIAEMFGGKVVDADALAKGKITPVQKFSELRREFRAGKVNQYE